MATITPDEARAYLQRWEVVRESEEAELRAQTPEVKIRQIAALISAHRVLGTDPQRDSEVQVVRDRWMRLRRALGG